MCHRLSYTVNSAVFCILNKHKLWSYIYTVCAFIGKEIYVIWSLEGAGWHIYWWWKAEINLQTVRLQCLRMSTENQGYEICYLCLCTALRISSSSPSSWFGSPLRQGWPLLQHTTAAQLTLKQWVSPQTGFRVNPYSTWALQAALMAHESKQFHWILLFYIWQNLYNHCWHKVRWQKSELKTFKKEQHQS